MQVQFLVYLLFCVIYKSNVAEKDKDALLFLALVLYIIIEKYLLRITGECWYATVLAFGLGVYYGRYKSALDKKIFDINRGGRMIASATIIFLISSLFGYTSVVPVLRLPLKIVANSIFPILAIWMSGFVRNSLKPFKFLGKISLEIYLSHGIFLYVSPRFMNNDFIYIIYIYGITIIFSLLIHPLLHNIQKRILLDRKVTGGNKRR